MDVEEVIVSYQRQKHPEVQINLTQYDKTPHRAKAVTVQLRARVEALAT